METTEKFEKIKNRVVNPETYLSIVRVPRKTKAEFITFAKEDFEGDYGMCFKYIFDFYMGAMSNPNEVMEEKINALAEEISQIKTKLEQPKEENVIRAVNGRIIRRG